MSNRKQSKGIESNQKQLNWINSSQKQQRATQNTQRQILYYMSDIDYITLHYIISKIISYVIVKNRTVPFSPRGPAFLSLDARRRQLLKAFAQTMRMHTYLYIYIYIYRFTVSSPDRCGKLISVQSEFLTPFWSRDAVIFPLAQRLGG